MADIQMGSSEKSFAEMIWENEPITAVDLAKMAEERFQWKKTTTYTVLKRLCNKGIFENKGGLVVSALSKEEYHSIHSQNYVGDHFKGSLPAFLAAFTRGKGLSREEYDEIRTIIDTAHSGDKNGD